MSKKKVLYCFAGNSIFGYRDIEMLSNFYQIYYCHFSIGKNIFTKVINYITYNFLVFKNLLKSDVVLINFGAWHTIFPVFLAKILNRKSIILLGGFDVANVPSLGYGIFHKPSLLQSLLRLTYRNASFLCPVSEALVSSNNKYADPTGIGYKNGLLNFLPEIKDKIKVIPTDYDADFWNYNNSDSREGVLALAYIYQPQTYLLKGFDILINCARVMPDTPFTFAGFSPEMVDKYEHEMPSNVKLLSFQNKQESKELYTKHKIFAIPSMTEGLPNTLCEAMLCGCIPVGSNIEVIAHIINDTGLTLISKDEILLKGLIEIALIDDNLSPEKSRKRILELYPNGSRIVQLQKIIN